VPARMLIEGQCPNCGGRITDERLALGLPCESCLPQVPEHLARGSGASRLEFLREVVKLLDELGKLGGYAALLQEEEELGEFEKFFEKALGNRPWSAQRTWARRVLRGSSFTILAPTGVGKSVFGIVMALFLAARGKKSYIVLPTSVLVKQVRDRAEFFRERVGVGARVLAYLPAGSKDRVETLERVQRGDFDILVTTSSFLAKNFDIMKNLQFDFVFVDDVDAIIKSSKNIERILQLLGLPKEAVDEALKLVRLSVARRGAKGDAAMEEYKAGKEKLRGLLAKAKVGVLVVSTATGRPRGLRVKLFRELLNFEIGSRAELLRNVVDAYTVVKEGELEARVAEIVARLGKGGLVFVQPGTPAERVNLLLKELENRGIRAKFVTSKNKKDIEAFENGEVDVLIGYAMYYGLLVRGIDLPHVIRYAVFADVPHFRFAADVEEASPLRLLQLAQVFRSVLAGSEAMALDRLVASLRRGLFNLEQEAYRLLSESLATGTRPDGYLGHLYDRLVELRKILRDLVSRENLVKELERRALVSLRPLNGKLYLLLPDAPTYLQASGRTSRMYAGGLSKGLSVVVAGDERLLEALMKQVAWYSDDVSWVKLEELDLSKILAEIDRDRELIRELARGGARRETADLVKTALVVVESPTKARTIASFFGRPSRRNVGGLPVYEVSTGNLILLIAASKGHVLDLITGGSEPARARRMLWGVIVEDGSAFIPVYATIKRCLNCGEQFTEGKNGACPYCGSTNIADQAAVINALKRAASEVDLVLLATDPDTEGEKIAWDLYVLLKPYTGTVRRIEFHEVTRRAFEEALRNQRDVDVRRVEAQLVRRVEDRWIGFSLSMKLWERFGKRWLSAGRVQTPVLGWVIDRYNEVKKSVKTIFSVKLENGWQLTFESDVAGREAVEVAKKLAESRVTIERVGSEEVKLPPPPPYTTDALLREAAANLRLSVSEVMRLAQDLFELGLITYHRTDSVHVSATGIGIAKAYLTERAMQQLFVGRSWAPPGTHECIRPTRPYDAETLRALVNQGVLQLVRQLTPHHYRLYDMIFRRFVASQMREAVVKVERFKACASVNSLELSREITIYSEIVEQGFAAVYRPFNLVKLEPGTYKVVGVTRSRRPTLRLYTQADLIALMKENGIGRPSTYAKIVSTLFERKYVIETKRRTIAPTKLGREVYAYLSDKFGNMISVERTRKVEEEMDKVERGERNYIDVLREFYREVVSIEGVV